MFWHVISWVISVDVVATVSFWVGTVLKVKIQVISIISVVSIISVASSWVGTKWVTI